MRYRAEARADLYEVYGVSLAELIAQRRLVELAELLQQLPQASRFWGAIVSRDEEYAEMVAQASLYRDDDGTEDAPQWAPDYKDYDAKYQLGTQIHDMLGIVNYTVAAVQGGKPKKPRSFPTPVTAIDRAQQAAEKNMADSLLSKMGRGGLNSGPTVKPTLHRRAAEPEIEY